MQIALKELKVLGTFSRTQIFRFSRSLYVATGLRLEFFNGENSSGGAAAAWNSHWASFYCPLLQLASSQPLFTCLQ